MKKSALQPRSRKTPRGGRKMAKMILRISLLDISICLLEFLSTTRANGEADEQ
jgi:hypothetical protein